METKPQGLAAGMLLATVGTGIAQPATDFVRMPDLTNNARYCFGWGWGREERRCNRS